MSTLNDHLRNLLDEVPGCQARDFLKAWNREQRTICQERRWRDLRTQWQFAIGTSTANGTDSSALPYTTGTVSGTYNTTTITGSGTTWLAAWNGLNHVQIQVGNYIYDVTAVNNGAQTLTVSPPLKAALSGNTYRMFWIPGAMLPTDMMGLRWLGKLDTISRVETEMQQPYDYAMDRVVDGHPFIELQDSGNYGDFMLHYYRFPTAATGMGSTLDLPTYVQDAIYTRLLLRYLDRAAIAPEIKSYMHAEARDRAQRAMRTAVTADETQERNQGGNQPTIWIQDRYSTVR